MPQNKSIFYFRLHLIVFIFGFTGILGQLISANAITLVWHRMWIASVLVFIYLLIKRPSKINWRGSGAMLLAGLLIAAHWISFFHSIKISNVSVTLATVSTAAFFGSIIEPIFYRRRFSFREMLLGLMVIAGLFLIFRFEGQYTAGILVALLSAFLAALFQVVNGKLVQKHSANKITFFEMIGGWLGISVFLILSGAIDISLFELSGMDWLWLIILGSVCTAYAFIESVAVMKEISPFTFLLSINMEPVYGILLALAIFGDSEKMNPFFYLGAAIILSSLFLDVYLRRRKRRQAALSQNL